MKPPDIDFLLKMGMLAFIVSGAGAMMVIAAMIIKEYW